MSVLTFWRDFASGGGRTASSGDINRASRRPHPLCLLVAAERRKEKKKKKEKKEQEQDTNTMLLFSNFNFTRRKFHVSR